MMMSLDILAGFEGIRFAAMYEKVYGCETRGSGLWVRATGYEG
jgi:hypothetical protein